MQETIYKALVVRESSEGEFTREVESRNMKELPNGELLVRVHYSSLNYKDALSASGNRGVTRNYPHVPGIDAAGVVAESTTDEFSEGDEVIVSGFDLGMNTDGGYGQYVRVPAGWALPCTEGLSLREAMIYGTAGFTAAQSVDRLVNYPVEPEQGKILVTGATGGVGSIAVSIMSKLGYHVVGVSGKPEADEFLAKLGAKGVITRDQATDSSARLVLKGKWSGVIDTVGGDILATATKSTAYGGVVTCCGNAASPDLPLSVYPFILRGVALLGIDSANYPKHKRGYIWQKLANEWRVDSLDSLATEVHLSELSGLIETILQGRQKGRVVVNLL